MEWCRVSRGAPLRTIARRAVYQYLGEFRVGRQDRLRGIHRARPASFPAMPAAYVGPIVDTLRFPGSARQRDLAVQVVLVGDLSADNEHTADMLDALADDLIDELSVRRHLVHDDGVHLSAGDTIQEPQRAEGGELDLGGVLYPVVIVTLLAHIEEAIQ